MTTKQVTAVNVNEQIKQLYQTAFPKDEQIPWNDLVRLIGDMHLDFTAYYEGEDFIGFTIVFPHEPFNWYWYFAVLPAITIDLSRANYQEATPVYSTDINN